MYPNIDKTCLNINETCSNRLLVLFKIRIYGLVFASSRPLLFAVCCHYVLPFMIADCHSSFMDFTIGHKIGKPMSFTCFQKGKEEKNLDWPNQTNPRPILIQNSNPSKILDFTNFTPYCKWFFSGVASYRVINSNPAILILNFMT